MKTETSEHDDSRRETAPRTLKQRLGRRLYTSLPYTRFLLDQLRVEARAHQVAVLNRLLPGQRRRLREIAQGRDLLVNVACGPQVLPGFVNLDLQDVTPGTVAWDCRRRLPVADGGARGIKAEHFIEHLEPREELPGFLADCRRALAEGGVLRVVVPDAGRYLEAYLRDDLGGFEVLGVPAPFPDDLPTRMDVVNHVFHQWHEHRWGYDFETLRHRLERAGFRRVERARFGVSALPELGCDREVHAPYSLYVEAFR